jgi:hypothetical protein
MEEYDYCTDMLFSFGLTFLFPCKRISYVIGDVSDSHGLLWPLAFSVNLFLGIPVQNPLLAVRSCSNVGIAIMITHFFEQ